MLFAGKSRAKEAALSAIQSPLLDVGIERATGIVWNITGGSDMTLFEVTTIVNASVCFLYHLGLGGVINSFPAGQCCSGGDL